MTLEEIAKKMCARGKGILAADESTGTMDKRLTSVGVECTDKNRLNFRETLFTSDAIKNYIGGVILFDTTIREKTITGISIPELLEKNNSVVGIKVDKGTKKLAGSPEETITDGLDGLRERLSDYYKLGARFTK
jgi:fructose-bisphosphate aldolase class I